MRTLTCLVGLLALGAALAGAAAPQNAPAKGSPLAKVARSAETLFKNADADKSGTLTQVELKKIEKPLAAKLREFAADPQIERALFAEHALNPDRETPEPVDNDAVTPDEFKEKMLGVLSSKFAATQWQPAANPLPANNVGQQPRNNRRDDETAAERRDRERREDEDRQRQSRMQDAQRQFRAAQERDSFRTTPPPRERPNPGRESAPRPTGGRESGPKVGGPGNKR